MVMVVAFRTEEKGRMAVVVIVRVDLEGAVVGDALVAHTQEMAVDIVWLVAVDGRRA